MPELSALQSLLHMGVLGLLAVMISVCSAAYLAVARILGAFYPTRVDIVRELVLLFSGPISVTLYGIASFADRLAIYWWGEGVDTDFPLKYGILGLSTLYFVAFISFFVASGSACLPRKKAHES